MEAKSDSQDILLAELRGLRGDLAELLDGSARNRRTASFIAQCGRALDRALMPPHTWQSVLDLVQARLSSDQPGSTDVT